MTCERCGGKVDVNGIGWAQEVTGWEVKRRAGGANQITQPKRLNRYLCPSCVVRMKTTGKEPEGQELLF